MHVESRGLESKKERRKRSSPEEALGKGPYRCIWLEYCDEIAREGKSGSDPMEKGIGDKNKEETATS